MQEYLIQQGSGEKGRVFSAHALALVTASGLFPEGCVDKPIRPAWVMFGGSEAQLRPFVANLRVGSKADLSGSGRRSSEKRLEFLRSVQYQAAWQKEAEGVLVTLFHPDLFRMDPGMIDPEGAKFILLVPFHWLALQTVDFRPALEHVLRLNYPIEGGSLCKAAYLFAAYLDRRTRCPLIADGRFYLQVLCAALHQGLASVPGTDTTYGSRYSRGWDHHREHGFDATGLDQVGVPVAISFLASHDRLEAFLAEQVAIYYDRIR